MAPDNREYPHFFLFPHILTYVIGKLRNILQGTSDEYHNIFLMEKYEKYQYFSVESRA